MSYLRGEGTPQEGCLFCAKCQMEDVEAHILYRGQHCYVTLNRFPYNNGHLMVVPYAHVPTLEKLEVRVLTEGVLLTRLSLRALEQAYGPDGFNVGMNIGEAAGAGMPEHIHFHVVPRWAGDTNYMSTVCRTRVIPEWMAQTYEQLKPLFERLSKEYKALQKQE